MSARILGVGTALPEGRVSQGEVRDRCLAAFAERGAKARASLFDRAGVETRHLVEATDWYFEGRAFGERNDAYLRHATELASSALSRALEASGIEWEELSHLFSVTTTGLLTPSLEARLGQTLPLGKTIKRTPLFGSGCAGGAVALARAAEYLRGHPEETIAVLSTELCSLSFLPRDGTVTQLVAAALFGDGAACAILCGARAPAAARARAELLESRSVLLPDSLHVMGWDFGADGMRLVLSPDAPAVVTREIRGALEPLLAGRGLTTADLGAFVLHPGSARILDACEQALGLPAWATAPSRAFLKRCGNLSSASVLFILGDVLRAGRQDRPEWGLLAALGPGFACEASLLRLA